MEDPMTRHRSLLVIAILAATLTFPALSRAENGPSPMPNNGFPMPDLSGIPLPSLNNLPGWANQMPQIQQVPGGYTVTVPGYPAIMVPTPTGVFNGAPTATGPETPWEYPSAPIPTPSQPTNPWITPNPTPTPMPTPVQPGTPWNPAPTQPPIVTPTPIPAPNPAPGPTAPPSSSGRVVGVFAGISDYPSGSDLAHCADDARNMAQAFIQAGIINQADAIVLMDHQATRRNLTNAIRELSARLGTNDTLVVFFSGHGDNRPDNNGDEMDGMDETIILADGVMVDDELVEQLRAARGRDLLALDSCYSGGFQADLDRVPNSVGFYASREDQLSYVANEFNAGGYLSHFMATGVRQSQGRQLQVGQLRQHIQQGFVSSGAAGRQDLVVGVGQGSSMATVLFNSSNGAAAYVASR